MGAKARPQPARLHRHRTIGATPRPEVYRHRQRGHLHRLWHWRKQAGSRATRRRGPVGAGPHMTSRCGFVAIVGAPNAGKSTLLNRMTGAKLSIVSPKAQTTRFRVLGILMHGASQVLLVDTPGIFRPKRKLDRAMVAAAWSGV